MKYLLIDTNMYLNIVVNRRKDVNNKLLETFSKLLQYGEIRIILPAIVRYEVFKHLEEEISKVGTNLECAKRKIEAIYWINGIDQETFNIDVYKKNAKMHIQQAYDYFNKNKETYITKVQSQINYIFDSEYTIFIDDIDDNEALINKAVRRKIYKKAPCHKKESYADAIIAEVLINLRDYIDIKNDDIVYFLSDNPEDFSKNDKEYKSALHPHIIKDLEKNQMNELVEYRLNFGEFISKDLSEEIENANVKEEFEREFEEDQTIGDADYYSYLDDMVRQSGGLPSLSSFYDLAYGVISESKEVKKMLYLFEMINDVYIELEEIQNFYWDEFSHTLTTYQNEENSNKLDKNHIIECFNEFIIQNKLRYYCYTIEDIVDWVTEQEELVSFDSYDMRLPDYIDLGEDIVLYDVNRDRILLSWKNTELSPESGESHTIYYEMKNINSMTEIAEGRVEIIYGFMEYDDSGDAGDGCRDDIMVRLKSVVDIVEDVYKELDELRNRHKNYITFISKNIIIQELV